MALEPRTFLLSAGQETRAASGWRILGWALLISIGLAVGPVEVGGLATVAGVASFVWNFELAGWITVLGLAHFLKYSTISAWTIPFIPADIALAIVLAVLVTKKLGRGAISFPRLNAIERCLLLFAGVVTVRAVAGGLDLGAAREVAQWAAAFLITLLLTRRLNSEQRLASILLWWLAFATAGALFTLATAWLEFLSGRGVTQRFGVNLSPHYGMAIGLALLIQGRSRRARRILLVGCVVAMLLAVALAMTRVYWVAVPAGAIAMSVAAKRVRVAVPILTLGGAAAGLLFMLGPSELVELLVFRARSFADLSHPHNVERASLLLMTLWMFLEDPLFGVGPNRFAALRDNYTVGFFQEFPEKLELVTSPHNQFLTVAVELGIVGLVTYLSIFFLVIRMLFGVWRERRDWISLALIGMWATYFVESLAATVAGGDRYFFPFLIGLLGSAHRLGRLGKHE